MGLKDDLLIRFHEVKHKVPNFKNQPEEEQNGAGLVYRQLHDSTVMWNNTQTGLYPVQQNASADHELG